MKFKNYILIFITFILFLSEVSYAQDGSLDNSFDNDGKVTTDFGFAENGTAIALQSDGKIVVAGVGFNGTTNYITLTRYNYDGSLDNTFDLDGKVTTMIGDDSKAYAVAIQTDGKIVVAGYADFGIDRDIAVIRYNSDGSVDTFFGSGGSAILNIGSGNDEVFGMALQSDDKIVLCGYTSNSVATTSDDFVLIRLESYGVIDITFDSDGVVTTAIGNLKDEAKSVAIQADGKILLAGNSNIGNNVAFAVARYNTNGSLDTSFDGDGIVITDFAATSDEGNAIAIQVDGKIIVAGFSENASNEDFALVRYNIDGSLDTSFDTDGKVSTPIGTGGDIINSMVIQIDGKIVVCGKSDNGSDFDFALCRYNDNGSIDNSFGISGIVTTAFGTDDDEANSIALQNDGKILVAGFKKVSGAPYNDFAVARYYNDLNVGLNAATDANLNLHVYPNPSTGNITIDWNASKNGTLQVYNYLGSEIIKSQISNQVELTNLAKGIYLIVINDGKNIKVNQLIIE